MTTHDTYDELVVGYALDTLEPEERRAFETHLAGCAECQVAVRESRRVSAAIGLSLEPVTPPASLRASTLARATGAHGGVGARLPASKLPRPSSAGSGSWPWLAQAASLTLVAGLGIYAWGLRSELANTRGLLADLSASAEVLRAELATARADSARLTNAVNVLRSVDVLRVDLRGQGAAPAAKGAAFVSASRGLIFNAESLPRLSTDRVYQLWVVPPGEGAAPVSAGIFTVDAAGASTLTLALPQGVTMVAAVAVTEEPAGGSLKATSFPLLLGTAVNN